ncbi:sarcosine oxidase subunit gamma [Xanthobacter sp. TB0139]|uniref:sarcosine oxidase subunit gamma n=1 Tax=Xanthobacter sp. TB0139 TaxID=3459178 RepID=UPI004039933D
MAENIITPLAPISAFAGAIGRAHFSATGAAIISERTGLGLATVTVRKGKLEALKAALAAHYGLNLRDGAKVSRSHELVLVGTGPDSWLALQEGGGWAFAKDLTAKLSGFASVADQSSGYGVVRLSGPAARSVLAKGVPVDLHPNAFRPDDAAVTLASHIGVILWQEPGETPEETPVYDMAVFRSFAESFWHWLAESAAEFGLKKAG